MPYALGPSGHRTHYRSVGSPGRPALVLIQGIGLDGRFWMQVPERLADDPERPWRVLVPDNRGVGRSDMPTRPWTMADMADDLAVMLDAEGIGQAVIVGISMGGMIAQQFALRHPRRVRGLVLMATWPGLPLARLPAPDMIRALLTPTLTGKRSVDALGALLLPPPLVAQAHTLLADWLELMRVQAPSRSAFLGQLGALASHSTGHRLGRIRVPTRVVTGDADRLVPPVNSERLAARIPDAQLEILPGVAHAIPLLDRDVVRRNVATMYG